MKDKEKAGRNSSKSSTQNCNADLIPVEGERGGRRAAGQSLGPHCSSGQDQWGSPKQRWSLEESHMEKKWLNSRNSALEWIPPSWGLWARISWRPCSRSRPTMFMGQNEWTWSQQGRQGRKQMMRSEKQQVCGRENFWSCRLFGYCKGFGIAFWIYWISYYWKTLNSFEQKWCHLTCFRRIPLAMCWKQTVRRSL